jgi:hypothetical protein
MTRRTTLMLHTCVLSASLSTGMFFGTAAMAAELPKEGAFTGTYSGFGTFKATPIGKERLLLVFDENGLTLTNGFLDHTNMHCWGLADFTYGVGQVHGYCVITDPAGDQVVGNLGPDEKHTPDQKSWRSSYNFTTGTGKYAGIGGSSTNVIHLNEFGPTPEGTYLIYITLQGTYKLP